MQTVSSSFPESFAGTVDGNSETTNSLSGTGDQEKRHDFVNKSTSFNYGDLYEDCYSAVDVLEVTYTTFHSPVSLSLFLISSPHFCSSFPVRDEDSNIS